MPSPCCSLWRFCRVSLRLCGDLCSVHIFLILLPSGMELRAFQLGGWVPPPSCSLLRFVGDSLVFRRFEKFSYISYYPTLWYGAQSLVIGWLSAAPPAICWDSVEIREDVVEICVFSCIFLLSYLLVWSSEPFIWMVECRRPPAFCGVFVELRWDVVETCVVSIYFLFSYHLGWSSEPFNWVVERRPLLQFVEIWSFVEILWRLEYASHIVLILLPSGMELRAF